MKVESTEYPWDKEKESGSYDWYGAPGVKFDQDEIAALKQEREEEEARSLEVEATLRIMEDLFPLPVEPSDVTPENIAQLKEFMEKDRGMNQQQIDATLTAYGLKKPQ